MSTLIFEPFVEVLASPVIYPATLDKYAEYRNLEIDAETPFSNLYCDVMDNESDGDNLSEFAGLS